MVGHCKRYSETYLFRPPEGPKWSYYSQASGYYGQVKKIIRLNN